MRASTTAWLVLCTALASAGGTLYLTHGPSWATEQGLDPVVLVGQVQELARLETASVELQTTVHGGRGQGWLRAAAGEELVFQGIGDASAGVDLGKLGPQDLWIDGDGAVWVRLPAAEVFRVDLDENRSQVLFREQGWLGRADGQLETEARQAALRQLAAQVAVMGLEDSAAAHAEVVVGDLLRALGAPEVHFATESEAAAGS